MYKAGYDSTIKDEGELNVAKRLISSAAKNHKNFVDIVVYDAFACNSVWINHCKNLGIDAVVRAKNNNNKSLRQVKKKVNKSASVEVWNDEKGFQKVEVYEDTFSMDKVIEPLRFVKYIMQLFLFRRLRKHFTSQREIVRLLLKRLYLLKLKSELVFNSA